MNATPLTPVSLAQLNEIYGRLTEQPPPAFEETWRLMAVNRIYQAELRLAAARWLRKFRLPCDRRDDLVQETLLILRQRLRHRGNLGFDRRYGREHFLPWLRAVVRLHCLHALRRLWPHKLAASQVEPQWVACYAPDTAWRAELADAIQSLDEPLREVLVAFGQLGTLEEVGRQLGLSTSTAWRRFQAALREVRPHCRPFAETGGPTGLKIVRKW